MLQSPPQLPVEDASDSIGGEEPDHAEGGCLSIKFPYVGEPLWEFNSLSVIQIKSQQVDWSYHQLHQEGRKQLGYILACSLRGVQYCLHLFAYNFGESKCGGHGDNIPREEEEEGGDRKHLGLNDSEMLNICFVLGNPNARIGAEGEEQILNGYGNIGNDGGVVGEIVGRVGECVDDVHPLELEGGEKRRRLLQQGCKSINYSCLHGLLSVRILYH